jgi:glycosyltransferase involved in cell wall biosynthesis
MVEDPSEMKNSAVELSIVMPCLNEAETLATCIQKAQQWLAAHHVDGEVVVADNGSTDGSREIAAKLGARVAPIAARGYGSALQGGIQAAKGRFVIMGDADDSYDFSNLQPFLDKLREGYDLVMGNRFRGGIKPGAMPPLHRYLGNPVLTGIGRLFFRSPCRDFHCGLRGFNREAILKLDLRTTGMEFASEMVVRATLSGLRITEVPTTLSPDGRSRPPHLRSWRDGWRHLRFLLLYAPNWLFLLPGGLLSIGGLALLLWLLPGPRTIGRVVLDIHTMLFGMVFVLLGVQIITIGLFAKVFCYVEQFDSRKRSLERILKRVKLEQGLMLGGVLAVVGLAGGAWTFWDWVETGFGQLHKVRELIFWMLWLCLGVQIVFSSFFLSMLGISRGTFIGGYEQE